MKNVFSLILSAIKHWYRNSKIFTKIGVVDGPQNHNNENGLLDSYSKTLIGQNNSSIWCFILECQFLWFTFLLNENRKKKYLELFILKQAYCIPLDCSYETDFLPNHPWKSPLSFTNKKRSSKNMQRALFRIKQKIFLKLVSFFEENHENSSN